MPINETVVAVYDDFETANTVLQALLDEGFLRGDVGLAVTNPNGDYNNLDFRFQRLEAANNGFDTLLANLAGTTFALTSIVIHGIGPIVAAGPLGDLLGEATGAVIGGVSASLVHLGIPHDEARYYAEVLRQGYALITVQVRTDKAMAIAMDILRHNHPINVKNKVDQWGGFDAKNELATHRDPVDQDEALFHSHTMHEAIGRFPYVPAALS